MIDYIRADAWRFADPQGREDGFTGCLLSPRTEFPRKFLDRGVSYDPLPQHLNPFELNVLYEMIALTQSVTALLTFFREEDTLGPDEIPKWMGDMDYPKDVLGGADGVDVPALPLQLLVSTAVVVGTAGASYPRPEHDDIVAWGMIQGWRMLTKGLRSKYRMWSNPEAIVVLNDQAMQRAIERDYKPGRISVLRPTLMLAVEALLRIAWLFECEEMDSIAFGPVSDQRLPTDPAKAVVALRRFAEQQPELRKVPAFVHVAPRNPALWMRPRDYSRMAFPPADADQTRAVAIDAFANRRYLHDHVAVIEVDRKPIKKLVLSPEVHDRRFGLTYLNCLIEHEKGWFAAEVMIGGDPDSPVFGLSLPFGSYAWRSLPDQERAVMAGGDAAELPPDQSIIGIVVAAWRDLIVANVREQHYEATVERDEDSKPRRRASRKAKRGHAKVVRYLPRTVVIRRLEQQERLERTGSTRRMTRAYRVGAFAKVLREGTHRSPEAAEFADEIGMPLRDDQTIVRPHIRGGTEAEREALLAQDDVRTWRSWAAVDLVFATRTRGAVE